MVRPTNILHPHLFVSTETTWTWMKTGSWLTKEKSWMKTFGCRRGMGYFDTTQIDMSSIVCISPIFTIYTASCSRDADRGVAECRLCRHDTTVTSVKGDERDRIYRAMSHFCNFCDDIHISVLTLRMVLTGHLILSRYHIYVAASASTVVLAGYLMYQMTGRYHIYMTTLTPE